MTEEKNCEYCGNKIDENFYGTVQHIDPRDGKAKTLYFHIRVGDESTPYCKNLFDDCHTRWWMEVPKRGTVELATPIWQWDGKSMVHNRFVIDAYGVRGKERSLFHEQERKQ